MARQSGQSSRDGMGSKKQGGHDHLDIVTGSQSRALSGRNRPSSRHGRDTAASAAVAASVLSFFAFLSQLPPIFCTAINLPGFAEVPYTFPVIVHPVAREACYILLLLSTDSITIELWMGASIWDTKT